MALVPSRLEAQVTANTGLSGYTIRPEAIWVESGSIFFVVDTRASDPRPHLISGGGALIWQLLVENSLTIDTLADITGMAPPELLPSAAAFLEDATAQGFLVQISSR